MLKFKSLDDMIDSLGLMEGSKVTPEDINNLKRRIIELTIMIHSLEKRVKELETKSGKQG